MSDIILKAENIYMEFPSGDTTIEVLHNINLNIKKNKLTMIVGPSGCGKTTTISVLTGLLTPSKGDIFFNNIEVNSLSNLERTLLRQKNIGFIFQQYNLLETLTAAENASIPLIAGGIQFDQAKSVATRVLQTLGMGNHADKLPSQLSGGEQQRVAIARALVHQPEFVVCDEPTASLDEQNGRKIMEILKEISADPNKAVLIVTHDNRIFDYADSIIHMNDGKIVEEKYSQPNKKKASR